MKKYLLSFAAVTCVLILVSWGDKGHRAVAKIAENHLTDKTKQAVKYLLGQRKHLLDVSNYADEIRSDRAYKFTGSWHYVNIPSGDNFGQFF